jgi:hypothetical protein
MFPPRFFGRRYYPGRYFPVGATVAVPAIDGPTALAFGRTGRTSATVAAGSTSVTLATGRTSLEVD